VGVGLLSEKCVLVDLANRNEFNRTLALGRITALSEEGARRRGGCALEPAGGPRKLVLVGVPTADEDSQ
jgi:hypothetical protein